MDECPYCKELCPVSVMSVGRGDSEHVCWDCLVAWPPPRKNGGKKIARAYPTGTPMSMAR